MHVAHVHCQIDAYARPAEELLDAWISARIVAEAAEGAGAQVTVLIASRHTADFTKNGVRYQFLPERQLPGRRGAGMEPWKLAREVAAIKPDLVHLHGLGFPIHTHAICQTGLPVLAQDHANRPAQRMAWLRRWGLRQVRALAFTSAEQALPMRRSGELPEHAAIFPIPECSTDFTAGDQASAREQSDVAGSPAVLWAGHLAPGKDPVTALKAFQKARQSEPKLQLWCAFGTDALLPELDAIIKAEPDLRSHVHLLGRLPHTEIEALCRACDLFISTSHAEGSGYALIEAMACGLVPVVSDIPAFRGLTGNGAVGQLAPPGDVDAFCDAIVHATEDWRGGARDEVLEHFDSHLAKDAIGRALLQAYNRVIAGEDAA